MDYVLDFARALAGGGTNGSASRGRRRSGAGLFGQLRIAMLGIMLGLAIPSLRGTDWASLLPGGVKVELPHGGKVSWPAGQVELPDLPSLPGLPRIVPVPLPGRAAATAAAPAATEARDTVSAQFGRCRRGYVGDCVVDGDTFRLAGEKVRIADIDTPETHPPRCAREARLGERATERMRNLLNAGPVTLAAYKRPHDKYGRRLAVVTRGGVSLGETLVTEGLARRYGGGKRAGWCGWV